MNSIGLDCILHAVFTPVPFFILTSGNIHAGTGIDVTLASLVLEPSAVILGATS